MRCQKLCIFLSMLTLIACEKKISGLQDGSKIIDSQNLAKSNLPGKEEGRLLNISQSPDLGMPKVQLYADTVYTSYSLDDGLVKSLPAGYENQIVSFRLPKGYMVVFAENSDGSGESACYVAIDSAIVANLPERLRNNISYIRYIAVNNPEKKGTASTSDATVNALGAQWFYGWSLNRSSFTGEQFVPMTWGKWTCTDNYVKYLVDRTDVDHLLSFNEPDNKNQSNIPNIDTAIARYKIMMKTGLRLGSPVTTQDQAFGDGRWLTKFMAKAAEQKVRVDYISIHWYDWGNQLNNKATDSLTAESIFNRFVAYIGRVHQAYPNLPIWITEYNANPNRTSKVIHEYFMKLSTDWMNSTNYIERYSYFFPNSVPAVNSDFSLTEAGQYWKDIVSPTSFTGNITSDAIHVN